MATKRKKKRVFSSTSDAAQQTVVELALQNPDLGARRLAPLLEKAGVEVSPSTIYAILKRCGLQTCAKRQATLKEQAGKRKSSRKKTAPKITDKAVARMVALSLKHAGYGAQRLVPLLKQEGIMVSASAAYKILKRNNLENRQKRLLELETRMDLEAIADAEAEIPDLLTEPPEKEPTVAGDELAYAVSEPGAAFSATPGGQEPAPADMPEPVAVAPAEPERPPARQAPVKPYKRRSHPAFYPLYLLLFVLIGYLGFQAFQAIQYARSEMGTEPAAGPAAAGIVAKIESLASERPLNVYRRIWERNLFNVSAEQAPAQHKEVAVEKLAPAEKDLGLTLVGTVVADDALLRRAFIDNSKTRRQEAFREGDTVGEVRIKKILRNRVVVATREGDRVLTSDILEAGMRPAASPAPQLAAASALAPEAETGEEEIGVIEASLKHEEVESGISEDDYLMKQVRIFPYTGDQGEQLEGFRISYIRAGNVLLEMGFRSGDVITGVDGEPVRSPDQAAEFFDRLYEGGEMTIDINRRRQPLKVRLNIG